MLRLTLETASTNIEDKCIDLLRYVEDGLLGEYMTGVHVLCSPEFFTKLTGHPKVEKAYENWQQGVMLINDVGEARAVSLGTIDNFSTYFAPANFNETVNTLNQTPYAKQEPRKFERGTDLYT